MFFSTTALTHPHISTASAVKSVCFRPHSKKAKKRRFPHEIIKGHQNHVFHYVKNDDLMTFTG
ncbi:hypothetical protein KIH39_23820 [Telmatocola sphagniphila]|uniref:Uncharacterized protein n=1 Tax=Telmatocola sphagniphila TaxID=1123043 RepID=A0A8E6B4J4_9BACT|nr:hypothetical protein [Telmatocola sphagniphila]QVL31828.1 hypothetical protein KIH39_23820 [Telmatocola sphagniphila]